MNIDIPKKQNRKSSIKLIGDLKRIEQETNLDSPIMDTFVLWNILTPYEDGDDDPDECFVLCIGEEDGDFHRFYSMRTGGLVRWKDDITKASGELSSWELAIHECLTLQHAELRRLVTSVSVKLERFVALLETFGTKTFWTDTGLLFEEETSKQLRSQQLTYKEIHTELDKRLKALDAYLYRRA